MRKVTAGQSLVWKTRTLARLDEEIIAIDVEAWVTLQTIAALRRVKGREGKTKGMSEGLGGQAAKDGTRRKGPVGKGTDKGKVKGIVTCSHCGKRGHDPSRCWTLHPEQHPWKGANSLGCAKPWWKAQAWTLVRSRMSSGWRRAVIVRDSGLVGSDHAESISRSAKANIGGLDILMPDKVIKVLVAQGCWSQLDAGKVTIESGAAEPVMPRDMLQHETLVVGVPKKSGVKYVAENGAKMDSYGEACALEEGAAERHQQHGFPGTDVGKPSAAVSRILDKGNSVVFSRGPKGSHVVSDQTVRRISLVEERGPFVMEVE